MALLDQLFRLRGAPRADKPPVTLGALVAALPPASAEKPARPDAEQAAVGVPVEPSPHSESPVVNSIAPVAAIADESSAVAPPKEEPAKLELPKFNEAVRGPLRSGARFNPFAIPAETPAEPGEDPAPQGSGGLGPCLEDPSLPPLRLQAQVPSDRDDRPVILGAASAASEDALAGELRQIEAPAVRLAPLKTPPRTPTPEAQAARADRPLKLRLEIEAESSLDVVAFKQHAAKFPGVVKCVISDAHD